MVFGKKIQRLPSHVVDLIKAGEVVERPASVVKELFENAVDALADEITVELMDGGKELIRVIDNGTGIPSTEISLALERHATSKLVVAEDLQSISSFGFRGEALASLAAVGEFCLRSKVEEDELGTEITLIAAVELSRKKVVMNRGTTVTLKELFAAVPARRKFLKSTATELAHVQDYLSSISLAYPAVSVTLKHNGKIVFQVKKTAELMERLTQVFSESPIEMVPFSYERGKTKIEGFAGKPKFARPSARFFVTFVNGRIVKDRFLRGGVLQAYSGLTVKGLASSCVLYVTLDPAQVDVNAHPAKTEVRFWDAPVMQDLVTIALQGALKDAATAEMAYSQPELAKLNQSKPSAAMVKEKNYPHSRGIVLEVTKPKSIFEMASLERPPGFAQEKNNELPFGRFREPRVEEVKNEVFATSRFQSGAQIASTLQTQIFDTVAQDVFGGAKYLGQYLNCYLLFERSVDLLVVDQHAFHERILFEELVLKKENLPIQEMLSPVLVPVTGAIGSLVELRLPELKKLGFVAEVLRSHELAIHAYPAFLNPSRAGEVFEEVLARILALESLSQEDHHPLIEKAKRCQGEFESLSPMERSLEAPSVFQLIYATMACHGAVRSGDALTENQVNLLLRKSAGIDFFAHCPHGRPVSKVWSKKEVQQWFLRI